ncbi:hypothetical protein [Streptomyces sp. JH34]|uniref:hypothetical protein n=1 Tax=unclassified Streptomyces TaxID=2593676 RepID=UPI0023F8B7F5|nr:hypothetical protein [Streptomyces sp. JH34]MDF6022953.1 hypothetical protein [Streptomyces sp. JH34]
MYDFPQDLRDAQLALHRTRTALDRCAGSLPWSAEPMTGWRAEKHLHSGYRSEKTDSPGYTAEQHDEVARLRKQLIDLSVTVFTHPYWATVDKSDAVEVRMALKHAHKTVDGVPRP